MPILTFFNYLYSFTQDPYYRVVGRHTRRYCTRASQKAKGETVKKVLMVATVGAEEFFAPLLGVSRGDMKAAPPRSIKAAVVLAAMRIYLSALLVTLGECKVALLAGMGIGERELLHLWCTVFEYRSEDMQRFDQVFVPAYQHHDIDRLASVACTDLAALPGVSQPEADMLKEALQADVTAVIRVLEKMGAR